MYEDEKTTNFVESLYKKVKNRARMKAVASELLKNSEHSAAHQILHRLLNLLEESGARFETILQIAECDLMINRRISRETDSQIMAAIKECDMSAYDLHSMSQERDNTVCVILKLYACRLLKDDRDDIESALKKMEKYTMTTTKDIEVMAENPKLKAAANKLALLPAEMVEYLKQMDVANVDLKVHAVAECLNRVGYVLDDLSRLHEALAYLKEGHNLMTDHFGADAAKYQIYAILANNIGATLLKQSDYNEAAFYHQHAVDDIQTADDISEPKRQEDLETYRRGLKISSGRSNPKYRQQPYSKSLDPPLRTSKSDEAQELRKENIDLGSRKQQENEMLSTEDRVLIQIKNALEEIRDRGKISQPTNRDLRTCLARYSLSWKDIRKLAAKQDDAEATLLHYYTCKLLSSSDKTDAAAREVTESFRHARNSIEGLIKKGESELAKSLVPLFHEIIEQLKEFRHSDEVLKVPPEADCLNKLGSIYILLSSHKDAVKYLGEGRIIMENVLGDNAPRYSVYGNMASSMGFAYEKRGEYALSAEYYGKAHDDVKRAGDIRQIAKKEKLADNEKAFQTMLARVDAESAERIRTGLDHYVRQAEERTRRQEPNYEVSAPSFNGGVTHEEDLLKPEEKHTSSSRIFKGGSSSDDVLSNTNGNTTQQEKKSVNEDDRVASEIPPPPSPFIHVGKGIYVDHTSRIRQNYPIFKGKFLGKDVAIKQLPFDKTSVDKPKMMMELKKHPNIVEYKQCSVWESREMPGLKFLYISMELCDDTLFEWAKRENLTEEDRLSSLLQFTTGLCHIHTQNIIHGRLSPGNILWSTHGDAVKIGDYLFGRKLVPGRSHITTVLSQSTKYRWLPPDKKLTKKSDVFSAGLVYYYVLSGGREMNQEEDLQNLTMIAQDLISHMIDLNDPDRRPTAEECAASPLFWDCKKKLHLLCRVADHISGMPKNALVVQLLDEKSQDVFGDSWKNSINLTEEEKVTLPQNLASSDDPASEEDSAAYVKAMEEQLKAFENFDTLSSLLQFIANCCRFPDIIDHKLRYIFHNDAETWDFFNKRFPDLFYTVYKVAEKAGFFWSTEKKFKFLEDVASKDTSNLEDKSKVIFEDEWLEKLVLDEAEVEAIQEKIKEEGSEYVMSENPIYNKAALVSNKEEATHYDEKSLQSLLKFIVNRRKYFKQDGKVAKWVFGDDTEGIWKYFLVRFPNLFDEIRLHVYGCNIPARV